MGKEFLLVAGGDPHGSNGRGATSAREREQQCEGFHAAMVVDARTGRIYLCGVPKEPSASNAPGGLAPPRARQPAQAVLEDPAVRA